jgi:hypothetical protein
MQVEICFTIVGGLSLTVSFDLCMSYGVDDVFALCLNWWKNANRNMFYHCWGIIFL